MAILGIKRLCVVRKHRPSVDVLGFHVFLKHGFCKQARVNIGECILARVIMGHARLTCAVVLTQDKPLYPVLTQAVRTLTHVNTCHAQ